MGEVRDGVNNCAAGVKHAKNRALQVTWDISDAGYQKSSPLIHLANSKPPNQDLMVLITSRRKAHLRDDSDAGADIIQSQGQKIDAVQRN